MADPVNDPQQPQTADEYYTRLNSLNIANDDAEKQEDRDAPMKSFWQRLLHGTGENRLKEVGRSVARGAASFVNETANTLGQLAEGAGRSQAESTAAVTKTELPKSGTDFRITSKESIDQVYGKQSDDPLASFAESATQFAIGFAATAPLGVVGTAGKVAKIASAAGRGALVDFTSFDPEGAGLAELLARAPVPGIREAGEALSTNPNDAEATKRLKRAAAGVIPGVALDAIVAGAQMAWARAAVKKGDKAAEAVGKDAAETLAKIARGEHVPEGAHVKVVGNEDGTFRIEPTDPKLTAGIDAEPLPTAGERLSGDAAGPKFSDRAEAEAQAETMNFAMNERLNAAKQAGGLTTEQANDLRATFYSFIRSADAGTNTLLTEGSHFNFSYYAEPDQVLASIESVSEVFKKELDAAQIVDGVSIAQQAKRLRELVGGIDPEQAPGLMTAMLENGSKLPQSVVFGAADIVLRDVAMKTSRLFDILEARPHDAVAWEEARFAAGNLVRLQKALAGAHSEWGRTGRFMQERDTFAAEVPLNAKQTTTRRGLKVDAPATAEEISAAELKAQKKLEIHKVRDPKAPHDVNAGGVEKTPDGVELAAGAEEATDALKSKREKGDFKTSAEDRPVPKDIAGMTQAEVLSVLKMAKMSGGSPSALMAIHTSADIIKETGLLRRGLEFFINAALSNPVTHATALTMNTLVSTYEAASKMLSAPVVAFRGGDGMGLFREGWDTLVANEMFVRDNLSTAMMAFRKGQSIIHPNEVHISAPGPIGHEIRTPSRGLLFVDEFTRVSNYRSFIYAKSLRYWRERGLENESLAKAVAQDLKNAFDAKTGVAVIPDGLKYAELPTMSAALGHDTPGGKLAEYLNKSIEAKFVAPFVKTSVNIFRYTFDRTPGLGRLAKRNRAIMAAGGEPAAVLQTQAAIATAVGTWAYMKAKSGDVTGQGPKEPGLRKLWLQDHKPYSIKINGEWYSYRRLDPLFTPISLMADVHDMVQELGKEDGATAEDLIAGSLAGLAAAFANKSYMTGMTQFFEAWSGGKGELVKKWLQGFGTTFTDPGLIRAVNNDPYLREVNSFKDAVWAGIPGLSEKLPARYNLFGEPEMASHSFMPASARGSAEETVASSLVALGHGFSPLPRKSVNGIKVDLSDGETFGKVDGLTPYEFMQKAMREPGDGEPSLRQALTEIVKSDDWKDATPGSEAYPGGSRAIIAGGVIDAYRRRAIGQMLEAFPRVQNELEVQQAAKGASIAEGQSGYLNALREFGRK